MNIILTPLRKAGLAVAGAAAVVLGLIIEEIEWRMTMPRV